MSTTKKLAIGLGIASGALLAAWLLTGSRKKKTTDFVKKNVGKITDKLKKQKSGFDDSEAHYV
ncbi:MAG: hypothetical protein MUF68_04700 [Cyclobacteriaceae bacterium]|jgi:hypothetical protein|nr:hypothetical protein [Cyclobacteriaceae bacterium]